MMNKEMGTIQEKIMEILWDAKKPLKPAEVQEKLCGCQAYTTIMTILSRMVTKKLLKRKMDGKAYYYYPTKSKEIYIENNLKNIYGSLMNSYGEMAIANFVDVIKNNKDDMELLKEYLKDNNEL